MARRESQSTKMLDVTRSYVPVDPNAFPITLHSASGEDSPERAKQVVPYEGYNFLPTSYGYKSYFGLTSKMDIDALTSRVDYLLILQTSQFVNIAVALCENGIWTKRADSTGSWTQEIPLPIPETGVHYDWSYCFIDNDFFAYRAGNASYYRFSNIPRAYSTIEIEAALPTIIPVDTMHPANEFYEQTPNFLNMEGQMGLFKAGSRLGFWDSENSISWSSIDDFLDFEPAVLTAAGSSKFLEVQGRITNILAMADGFVVYSTKSITLVARDDSGAMQWNPLVLMKDSGVAFKRECCAGASVTSQFAYTTTGLVKIEGTKADYIVPEISDFLKESREPVFLTLIEGRYLFLELLDSSYVDGLVEFKTKTIPADTITFPPNPIVYDPAKVDELEAIFNGESQALKDALDAWLLANGYPARGVNSIITPNLKAYVNDVEVVKPLADELPTIGREEFTVGGRRVLLGNFEFGDGVNPGPLVIGEDSIYANTVTFTPISYRIFYNQLRKPIFTKWTIEAGANRNREVLTASVGALMAEQTAIWEDRDAEVSDVLGYCAQYNDTTPLGAIVKSVTNRHTQGFKTPSNNTLNPCATYGDSAPLPNLTNPIVDKTVPRYSDFPEGDHYAVFMTPRRVSGQSTSFDFSWSTPVVVFDGTTAYIRRTRKSVAGIAGAVSATNRTVGFTYEPSSPWIGGMCFEGAADARWLPEAPKVSILVSEIETSMQVAVLSTENLANNPVQEARMEVESYTYFDVNGLEVTVPNNITLPPITPFVYEYQGSVTLPPVSFLLQNGSIGPVYPTIPGALVYDLQLQKWGKMKNDYKVLIDWSPLNNTAGNTIPYETFGMQGGILQPDGKIALFDKYPIDSYIKYGKIGYYRQGVTSAEEVRVVFRSACTGKIITETSLDNVSLELGLGRQEDYTNARDVVIYPSTTGKWHTISLIGQYDILNIEFRGTKVGNR